MVMVWHSVFGRLLRRVLYGRWLVVRLKSHSRVRWGRSRLLLPRATRSLFMLLFRLRMILLRFVIFPCRYVFRVKLLRWWVVGHILILKLILARGVLVPFRVSTPMLLLGRRRKFACRLGRKRLVRLSTPLRLTTLFWKTRFTLLNSMYRLRKSLMCRKSLGGNLFPRIVTISLGLRRIWIGWRGRFGSVVRCVLVLLRMVMILVMRRVPGVPSWQRFLRLRRVRLRRRSLVSVLVMVVVPLLKSLLRQLFPVLVTLMVIFGPRVVVRVRRRLMVRFVWHRGGRARTRRRRMRLTRWKRVRMMKLLRGVVLRVIL